MKKIVCILSAWVFVIVSGITFVDGSGSSSSKCGGSGKYREGERRVKKGKKWVIEKIKGPEICTIGPCPAGEGCTVYAKRKTDTVIITKPDGTRVEKTIVAANPTCHCE